jgi:hypothetical protein
MSGENPLSRHGTLYALAQAARDSDAIAEERGVVAAVEDVGLSYDDLKYVAEQRALRATLIHFDRLDELKAINDAQEFAAVELDAAEKAFLTLATAAYLDGITLGARWAQRRAAPYGHGAALT